MRSLVLLLLVGTAYAAIEMPQRIVGGDQTSVEVYPFMSNVHHHWFNIIWTQWCGGSLITTNSVLSAAHCFAGRATSTFRVLLGTSRATTGGSLHLAASIINHPRYNDPINDNDVAIIRLATPAVLSSTVGLARIAGPNYILPDHTPVRAVGWGDLQYQGSSPEMLQHVEVYTINQETCAERYAYLRTLPNFEHWPDVTASMLCAGVLDVGGRDACQGDSGGPLLHSGDIVVGVTSWGYRCADATYPGVNARVSHYTDWIVANA